MKVRILLASLLAVAASASWAGTSSQPICAGSAGDSASFTAASNTFVVTAFTIKCSNNVQLAWIEDATKVAVCANSKKGKNNFGGTTSTGGVTAAGACTVSDGACSAQGAVITNGCS